MCRAREISDDRAVRRLEQTRRCSQSVGTSLPPKRFNRSSLYPGTSRAISSRTASGSNGLSLGSRSFAASQTACRSASPACAPRDCPRSAGYAALAERHQRLYVCAHRARQANQNLEVRLHAGAIRSLLHQLHIAKGVGHGAGLFIETRSGQYHIGERAVSVRNRSCTTTKVFFRLSDAMSQLLTQDWRQQQAMHQVDSRQRRQSFAAALSTAAGRHPGYSAKAAGAETGTYPGSRSGNRPMSAAPREFA